ncbi:MAG: TetR/AcrR family transcriptional regulator [Microthrixaceae bacterium]
MPARMDLAAVLEAVGSAPDGGAAEPGPGRSASIDRVLDAALGCFVRDGVRSTTMSDVAAAASVSRVWVHRLVGSKDALVEAVLTREVHRLLAVSPDLVDPGRPPVETFARTAGEVVAHFSSHPLVRRFVEDEADQVVAAFTDGRFLSMVAERLSTLVAPGFSTGAERMRPIVEAATRVAVSLMIAPMRPGGDGAEAVEALMLAAFGPALSELGPPDPRGGEP